jgi:hypothetical protein
LLFQSLNHLGGEPLHQFPVGNAHRLGGSKDDTGNLGAIDWRFFL